MSEEILMNVTPIESRVAVIENGVLQELYIERSCNLGIVGNIYKGKVVRVLPGIQAAFVDIGLEKAAFIHVNEIYKETKTENKNNVSTTIDTPAIPSIDVLIKEGQSLIVQVIKDPLGSKGARLTTYLSLPARYLVYLPHSEHIGVSLRIEDEAERERLKSLVEQSIQDIHPDIVGGYILRTAAEGIGADEIKTDMLFLQKLWKDVDYEIQQAQGVATVYEDLSLPLRTMRDMVNSTIEKIRIDSTEAFKKVEKFVKKLIPQVDGRVEHYKQDRPIFDLFGVEDEINRALDRKVPLKSGGYLVLDQTEAMTIIDVNTGAFVGYRNLDETIFKTNLEAAVSIARQLRLRNLGGIIVIDFIDMENPEHKRQVLRALEKYAEKDHAKVKVTGVSELGLVEITRKRTRESLENVLCESCSECQGRGVLKTSETVCYEIFREIVRIYKAYESRSYLVLAAEKVIERMLDEESAHVADLEDFINCSIRFQVEPMYNQEQFDVVLS